MSFFNHAFESIALVLIGGALFAVLADVLMAVRSMHRPWPTVSVDPVRMNRGLETVVAVAFDQPVARIDEEVELLAA